MTYPEKLIRGISEENHVDENGYLSSAVFAFQDRPENPQLEESINWDDDDNAVIYSLNQKKAKNEDEYQFKGGIAIYNRSEIDRIACLAPFRNLLTYERAPKANNQYHGNLILDKQIPKLLKTQLSATLATHYIEIQKRKS